MRLLLDTHTLLWWLEDNPGLSDGARRAIGDYKNEVFLSVASVWEMAVKISLGRLTLSRPLPKLVGPELTASGITLLPVRAEHCFAVCKLSFHHRDPFDRMLVSQAIAESLRLVSKNAIFDSYPVTRLW
ncbi:MAG: type II toxin-antitoxin system VapC family toxin [Armatimonadetes bacterium]|nr:type II toxin-antitoxin system VapC family toxin [Armatimonadota bacterium]